MSDPDRAQLLSEAARAMAAARRVVGSIRCEECGTEIVATTAGRYKRRYCSARCNLRAYRRTHAAELTARQRERRAAARTSSPAAD